MKVLRLGLNTQGSDFVVGDIHGHFDEFEALIRKIHFDPNKDRMISVGDHIDRGPQNHRSLHYLAQPWFYSVRGNHEALLLGAQNDLPGLYDLWMRNGGDWAETMQRDALAPFVAQYERLPYLIDVETNKGHVGIVHADVPTDYKWPELLEKAENDELSPRDWNVMLWSRAVYQRLRLWILYPGLYHENRVEGVHRIYVGHSIVAMPIFFGNFGFIDTGAYAGGSLTAVNIGTEEMYSVPVIPMLKGPKPR